MTESRTPATVHVGLDVHAASVRLAAVRADELLDERHIAWTRATSMSATWSATIAVSPATSAAGRSLWVISWIVFMASRLEDHVLR